jgi:hypothetical protein
LDVWDSPNPSPPLVPGGRAHSLVREGVGEYLSRESGEEDQAHLLDRAPTQLALCLRFATDLKGESWLRTATLDDLKTPTPVLHNTSVVV